MHLISDKNDHPLWMPKTGGRYLLTGKDVQHQCGHNDNVHLDGHPGLFAMATGPEGAKLWICEGSHLYVNEPTYEKEFLGKGLRLKPVDIPPYSVYFGHGWVQHAGFGWDGKHRLRYHVYIMPGSQPLPDAVAFAYGTSLPRATSTASAPSANISEQHNTHNSETEHESYNITAQDIPDEET